MEKFTIDPLYYSVKFKKNTKTINLPPPSAAYMHQWFESALVQIMAWCLFGAKQLSKPVLGNCPLDPKQQPSVNFNQITKRFSHENAFENVVCEMVAILLRGRSVNASQQ